MYLSFYHLQHKPFQISTDPRFLWLGEKHEEALATLRYGVLDNKGFLLLTGDVGTGKTTLINALLKTLGNNVLAAILRDPDLEPMDFYNYTAHVFGMAGNFTSKGAFLIEFERFLHQASSAKKTVLLIIDEAQRINQKLLEEVRLLSNIEQEDRKLLNIFFVGQIEFNEILRRPENRPIRQRITVNYNIQPLTKKETGEYIRYRLKVAGTERKIFDEEAINALFSFSQGYPRLINIICDRSLLTGYVEEAQTITAEHVRECVEELTIPQFYMQKPSSACDPSPSEVVAAPSPDSQSLSLIRAKAKKKSVLPWTQILSAILIGAIIAASVFFLFPYFNTPGGHFLGEHTAKVWNQLFAQKETGPANKTPVLAENTHSSPESAQINTHPMKIAKPDKNQPEVSRSAPDDPHNRGQKTATRENTVVSDEPADGRHSLVAAPHTETENIQPLSLETYKKMIIPFPSDSSFPKGDMADDLDKLAQALLLQPEFKVIITGYTDSSGHEPYNQKLSEFRAHTVKSYLVGKGLAESRIIVQGLGSQDPIAPNETPAGRIANRRVEIELQE